MCHGSHTMALFYKHHAKEGQTMYPDGRPYFSLNCYLKQKFVTKVVKLSIDAGFSCPNRDGTISTGGCSFCSPRGSGDFTWGKQYSIFQQLDYGKKLVSAKWEHAKYIAYFQAFTNTYAPVEVLAQKYQEALSFPDLVGVSIATRPDCLGEDVITLLDALQKKTTLWVELGLQTSNEVTAEKIKRGYHNATFEQAVLSLHNKGIDVIVHVILGLPNETKEDMLKTIYYLNQLPIRGIKLQLLHVLEGTPLAQEYKDGSFQTLAQDEYIDILCQCIGYLRKDIIIHRLTGDGDSKLLLAPTWSLHKKMVLNAIHKELKKSQITQGCFISSNLHELS